MEPRLGIIYTTKCCGFRQLDGIGDMAPEDVAHAVVYANINRVTGKNARFYSFQDNTFRRASGHYGDELRDYIIDNDLGTVIETEPFKNPNSESILKAYVWTLNYDTMRDWYRDFINSSAEQVLESHGLEIGSFVRFDENSPNHFRGRAVIESMDNRGVLLRLQNGNNHRILADELDSLVETRAFTT